MTYIVKRKRFEVAGSVKYFILKVRGFWIFKIFISTGEKFEHFYHATARANELNGGDGQNG